MSKDEPDVMEVWARELSRLVCQIMPREQVGRFYEASLEAGLIDPPEQADEKPGKAPVPKDPTNDPAYSHVINPKAHAMEQAEKAKLAGDRPAEDPEPEKEPAPCKPEKQDETKSKAKPITK